MMRGRVGVSILDCDFGRLCEELEEMRRSGVTNVHLDIMDTTFVGNITFGACIANRVLAHDFVFDIHMMVSSPLGVLEQLDLRNVSLVTVHHEAGDRPGVGEYLRARGILVGVAVNPETPMSDVETDGADFVLVMSVSPGFGGQRLREECLQKVGEARRRGKMVGVDGGVGADNISMVVGADYVVVGSAYFRAADRKGFLDGITRRFLGGRLQG